MARVRVYLPDELYNAVKAHRWSASELLQNAIRAELRRQALIDEADRYLSELIDEVGEPSQDEIAAADQFVSQLRADLGASATG